MRIAVEALVVTLVVVADGCRLYVDPAVGVDSNPGGPSAPLRTLQAAAEGVHAGCVVTLRKGTHLGPLHLDHRHSHTVWEGEEGALVTGGTTVPTEAFVSEGEYKVADLSKHPFDTIDLGELETPPGLGQCGNSKKAEAFAPSGERLILARYPNIGDDGFWRYMQVERNTSNGIVYKEEWTRPAQWVNATDWYLHGYWGWDWADSYVKAGRVDPANRTIEVTTPFCYYAKPNARFYALNLLSELDTPQEYYIDRVKRRLYVHREWQGPVVLSTQQHTVSAQHAVNLTLSSLRVSFGKSINVYWHDVNNSRIEGSHMGSAGGQGVTLYGNGVVIEGSTVNQTGCEGIAVDGGDPSTLQPSRNTVRQNDISHFGLWRRTYNPGVRFAGVGQVVVGNTIWFGPHAGVLGGGNDHVFEGNVLRNVAWEVTDTGAWYAGRSWVHRNVTIRNNTFEDIHNKVPVYLGSPSINGIYNDDQLSGNTIVDNTFRNVHCGVFIGGGRHHTVARNTFGFNVSVPVHLDDRGLTWQTDFCTPPSGLFWEQLKEVNATYSQHYPELRNIDRPCVPVHNNISYNTWCGDVPFHDFSDKDARSWGVTLTGNRRTACP